MVDPKFSNRTQKLNVAKIVSLEPCDPNTYSFDCSAITQTVDPIAELNRLLDPHVNKYVTREKLSTSK